MIALVVTIIVLLILAGVTITAVLGEDGIIERAQEAADKTKNAVDRESEDFEKLNSLLSEYGGGTGGESPTPPDPADEPEEKNDIAKEYGVKQTGANKTITESDTESGTNKSITIPQGYTLVDPAQDPTVQYADPNNPKIDEGIVITDAVDGKSGGNEFVWVPVPKPEEMYGIDSNDDTKYLGKLYDFGTSSAPKETPAPRNWKDAGDGKISWKLTTGVGSYREPAVLTDSSCDANQDKLNIVVEDKYKTGDTKTIDNFKTQLQEEFKAMIESVKKYKGFYIGRYETSKLNTEKPEVKPGEPTVKTNWYTMYKNSKKIAQESSGATSSMIWGSQWDATMKWFISCGGTAKTYVTNSEGMGWYSGVTGNESHKTGEPLTEEIKNRVNNIYDLAGNVSEWTIEANDTYSRARRGGDYDHSGSSRPASDRNYYLPTYSNGNGDVSSRAVLYVNL